MEKFISVLAIITPLAGLQYYFFNKIHNDLDRMDRRLDGHANRIDRLYQMFCDLLKERN